MMIAPGDPGAIRCRWCKTGRIRRADVLVCPACDHADLMPVRGGSLDGPIDRPETP